MWTANQRSVPSRYQGSATGWTLEGLYSHKLLQDSIDRALTCTAPYCVRRGASVAESLLQTFQEVGNDRLEVLRLLHVGQVRGIFDHDLLNRWDFFDHVISRCQNIRRVPGANNDQNGYFQVAQTVKC